MKKLKKMVKSAIKKVLLTSNENIHSEFVRTISHSTKPYKKVDKVKLLLKLNLKYRIFRSKSYKKVNGYKDGQNRKSVDEMVKLLSQYDVISFDMFDTLVFRPYHRPSDLFYLLGCKLKVFNFPELRVLAESRARQKSSSREINIYDIYKELEKLCGIDPSLASEEINLEKEMIYKNPYMFEIFNKLKQLNKTMVVTSDMYLTKDMLEDILKVNDYVGFDNIFVSVEYGCSKADGELLSRVQETYKGKRIIHIGDNIVADVIGAQSVGLDCYYYQQCNQIGDKYRCKNMISRVASMYKGIVNNCLYSGANTNMNPQEKFAFINAGFMVTGYLEWINDFVKNNSLDKILFIARDMDIFYKMYNKHYKEYDNEYIVTSRFSLQELIVDKYPLEFFNNTIRTRVNKNYTIERSLKEINLEVLLSKLDGYGLKSTDCIHDGNINSIQSLFLENVDCITNQFKDNEEAAKRYFKEIINGSKKLCIADIGWRGSIILYLHYLLVEKWKLCDEVKGVLFANSISTYSTDLVDSGVISVYAYNHKINTNYLRNQNPDMELMNSITMESIFTSTDSSLLEYRLDKEKDIPVLIKAETVEHNKDIINSFQGGIETFVDEFERHRKNYRCYYKTSAVDVYEPMFTITKNYNYIASIIGNVLDTPHSIAGLGIKDKQYVSLGQRLYENGLIKKWPLKDKSNKNVEL